MAPHPTETRVSDYCREERLLDGLDRLYVGFSGGPDSAALLLILHEMVPRLTAVHLHHGLRGTDADADMEWCEEFCRGRAIPFQSARLDVPANRGGNESEEMASRRLRLEYWHSVASTDGAAVALGHHLDDRLETFFMNLLRGTGTGGLSGPKPRRTVEGVRLIRPLLCLRRQDIMEYLAAIGVDDFREDLSNMDLRFLRNRIRHQVIPSLINAGAGDMKGVFKSLQFISDDSAVIDRLADDDAVSAQDLLPLSLLAAMDRGRRVRVMRRWLSRQLGHDRPLRQSHALELERLLATDAREPAAIDLDPEHRLRAIGDCLVLEHTSAAAVPVPLSEPVHWLWTQTPVMEIPDMSVRFVAVQVNADTCPPPAELGPDQECFDTDAISACLVLRRRQPGDRMHPFGRRRSQKVKDLISRASLSREAKGRLVTICNDDGEIIWVPGVRRAEVGRVSPDADSAVIFKRETL